MGRNTAADAASALRLLNSEDLRHPPAHGPQQRRSNATTPAAPLNVGIVDYIDRTVAEIVDHTVTITAQPKALPAKIEGLYDWYFEETADAVADDDTERRYRDALIETHRLEHAIRLGETEEVCKHPCPGCGCWGLEWDHGGNRALCLNRKCRAPDGMSSTWTLERLAAQKVRRTEIWRRNAT
ncbi:hypothetical protein [Streptomyces sp. NBC_00847]|uniref:hypothetical protein n=1 Tax=Streptomyces sp. NBC_00847 TaxID=2975850 RepID=UPI00225DE632|nr:hypothetical protein [Streptomyces sp. NBC_00847]MCX4885944.1 hypothetical protein [Streptomyces sp. NBC_00847]